MPRVCAAVLGETRARRSRRQPSRIRIVQYTAAAYSGVGVQETGTTGYSSNSVRVGDPAWPLASWELGRNQRIRAATLLRVTWLACIVGCKVLLVPTTYYRRRRSSDVQATYEQSQNRVLLSE